MVHSPPSQARPLHNTCITASTHQVLWSTPLPARPDLSTTPVSPPPLTKSCGPLPSQPGQTSPQHLYHRLHSPSLVVHSPPSQARPLHNTCITASTHQVLWSTPLPARPDLSTTPVSLPPLTKSCGPLPSQPGQTSPQHLYHRLHSLSLVVHSPPSQARPLNNTCITASTHQVLWSTPLPARSDLSTTPVSPPPLTKSCGPLPSQPGQTSQQHLYHCLHSLSLVVHSPPSQARPLNNTCITASTHQVLWSTPLPARPDLSTTPVSPPPLTKSCGPLPSQPGQTFPHHLYHRPHSLSLVVHSPPSQARPLNNTCITAPTH